MTDPMIQYLQLDPNDRDLDRLLAEGGFPRVDGTKVTFVYRGRADQVHLRHWVYGLPAELPFAPIKGTDLWQFQLELPPRSRLEYKIGVQRGGHEEWIQDPLNDRIAHDPFGGNSVVHGAGYEVPEWTQHDASSTPGRLEDITVKSKVFKERRVVRVYLPARFRTNRRYRLLVVHDGDDYLNYAAFQTVLDNLIERLEIPPLIVAFTNSPDRLVEYPNQQAHATHIVREVVPAIEASFPVIPEASARCLMGASFGGVASLSTAWRFPLFFDHLILQSGSFAFTDIGSHHRGPLFDPVVDFMNQFRHRPDRFARRVCVTCGVYESLIYENRSLVPFLQQHGVQVQYSESRDGHNWENWRDRLREALTWVFPGPLWVTYD